MFLYKEKKTYIDSYIGFISIEMKWNDSFSHYGEVLYGL